jgi:type I restriction enzyme R subunit
VKVKPEAGEQNVTVWLVDWKNPTKNDFAIAEEVTVAGVHDKRPDLMLYLNGIAVGVIELKRSIISIAEGIRQNLDNQTKAFIRPFYATVQLVMAGNDTEGLRYGVIETPERYYLGWKEDSAIEDLLDRAITQLCNKERLLEVIHDFMVFDAGTKKTCRHSQYFGVHAAQQAIKKREGGIIWHTQGSGKSLTMVWLAKWIREHVENARVLLITDRTDLDEQIEKVFKGVDEDIYRTKSGKDLIDVLNKSDEWLVCSLIHKFGASDEIDIKSYIKEIQQYLPKGFQAKGDIFVFVDECHRTHTGDLHEAMKALLPGAMFIGFTGTPLLKKDKKKSLEVFGPYIHTYKYDEAVRDGVVLDLRYEARDIDQYITNPTKIDAWFDAKTSALTDVAKAQLKKRWGTMRKVESSEPRLKIIVDDILMDMETRDRLKSGHGNALLVSSSIYNACRFYEMFQKSDLAGKCAIITSYKPTPGDIKGEETGEGKTEKLRQYDIYRKMLADYFNESEDESMTKVEQFELEVKRRFIDEPGQMKLLIVVDKLLTGFDAPPATYLYIDKQMHDHGLFQAICRVNRLDSEDKEYGYVIDYKDLFKALEKSIHDYTGEAFAAYDAEDVQGLLTDRLTKSKEHLEELLDSVKALCEPVTPPKNTINYVHYFCGKSGDGDELEDNEQKRVALYKTVAALLRAYADLANEMTDAGYSEKESQEIKEEVAYYEKVREEIKLASGDYVDMKVFEPAMRHLLDTYIKADESTKLSAFDDMTLVQLVVDQGQRAIEKLPDGLRKDPEAMAEAIENNVRRLIIDESPVNPKYFEKMSELLEALIRERKDQALHYTEYLAKIVALARKVQKPESTTSYPAALNTGALRALYDNLDKDEKLAVRVDAAIRAVKKDGWRGNRFKEREVRAAIKSALDGDDGILNKIFEIAKAQREY